MKKFIVLISALVFIIATIVFYPKKVPYSLGVTGKLLPARDLTVTRSSSNMLTVIDNDNLHGIQKSIFTSELQRGDIISFHVHPLIVNGASVARGDTIGWFESHEIELELVQLKGELAIERATLQAARAGEKATVIEEYEKLLDASREELTEYGKITDRQKRLLEHKLIPEQEYEISLSQLNLYAIAVKKAEAQLKTVKTGMRREDIALIMSKIGSLEESIAAYEKKKAEQTIIAPYSGKVLNTSAINILEDDETVFTIADTSRFCLRLPVRLKNRRFVSQGQNLSIYIENHKEPLPGTIVSVGSMVRAITDEQVVMATASCDASGQNLFPGTVVSCEIILEPVSLLEYCCRTINTVFNR